MRPLRPPGRLSGPRSVVYVKPCTGFYMRTKPLAERIKTLFREQGITIVSDPYGPRDDYFYNSPRYPGRFWRRRRPTTAAAAPRKGRGQRVDQKTTPKISEESWPSWLARAAAALPGIIGSIVSWLLSLLGKTAVWLSSNLWAVLLAVGGLLLVAAREWLLPKKPKQS